MRGKAKRINSSNKISIGESQKDGSAILLTEEEVENVRQYILLGKSYKELSKNEKAYLKLRDESRYGCKDIKETLALVKNLQKQVDVLQDEVEAYKEYAEITAKKLEGIFISKKMKKYDIRCNAINKEIARLPCHQAVRNMLTDELKEIMGDDKNNLEVKSGLLDKIAKKVEDILSEEASKAKKKGLVKI